MADRPLRLGPDPNRTHMERWNQMHPDRYGRPDTPVASTDHGWSHSEAGNEAVGGSGGFLEILLGLTILALAPPIGAIVTFHTYQWTKPGDLTPGWVLGYIAIFLVTSWIVAMLINALRKVILAAAIAGMTFCLGYATWHLWIR